MLVAHLSSMDEKVIFCGDEDIRDKVTIVNI